MVILVAMRRNPGFATLRKRRDEADQVREEVTTRRQGPANVSTM